MQKAYSIVLLLLICISYSCKPGSEGSAQFADQVQLPEKEFYEFEVRKNLDKAEEILLSTIAEQIRYIPLETTSSCLLSRCRQVEIFNNKIFVKDSKALYKFDMDGRFIQQIGKIGNGPGEYGSVLWFNFIASTNEIILYSYPTGRINIHDAGSGEFKRSFRLDIEPCGVVEFPPGKLSFLTWNTRQSESQNSNPEIYFCTLEGTILDSISDERVPRTGNISGPVRYYIHNETLCYKDFFQDTLYSISNEAKKEAYVSFGLENKAHGNELEMTRLIGEIQFPDHLIIGKVLENESSFYFTVEMGLGFHISSEEQKFLFNKNAGQLFSCDSLTNDLDGGIPIWPESIYKDSLLIDFYPAIEFLEFFQTHPENPGRTQELNDLINTLDENDNPVVILASHAEDH